MITKVTLRQKGIKNSMESLYLDFYPPIKNIQVNKDTRREFLRLYIFQNPKSPIEKKHNAETKKIAESIRQQRENILNKPEIYSDSEKETLKHIEIQKSSFIDYLEKLSKKRKGNNITVWNIAIQYLKDFTNDQLLFEQLNTDLFDEFKDYLLTTKSKRSKSKKLSKNSAVSYFNKIKAGLKQAFIDGYLIQNLNDKIRPIKEEETHKQFLTIEELKKLVLYPCKSEVHKNAGLFSALTGLRFSDIQKLTWNEIEYIEKEGYILKYKQKKTSNVEVIPISDQAYSFTNGTRNPKEMDQTKKVFENLVYSAQRNTLLKEWIQSAGITKNITFHCFRHTYATLQLYNGTDIYTVSKMLGHKNLKNTQIYAKIVDAKKRETVNKIQLDL